MSCWRYCNECDAEQNMPKTPTEDVTCSSCGNTMHCTLTTNEWIEKLLERIDNLERRREE